MIGQPANDLRGNREVASAAPAAEDIAIVGMACLFPGADTPARFWQNIVDRVDCIGDPPPDWQPELFLPQAPDQPDRVYTGRGGYLGELCRFGPAKYGIMPNSVDGAEPDQFVAFRCAAEALADAGAAHLPLNREKTGVIVGRGIFLNRGLLTLIGHGFVLDQVIALLRQLDPGRGEDELARLRAELKRNLPPFHAETVPGLTHNVLAGRIANRLDLMGPSYTVDAACASSLIAVDHAMRELRSGRCDAVIAGGAQVSTPGLINLAFCQLEALSRTGCAAPFSADANGTLLGQGCGMLVLKRRSDAERDGHRIYALIKGVGVASDGKGMGLLAPRFEGQKLSIERAYAETGIPTSTIELIEAHGTGIPLGDATEIRSLVSCFGQRTGPKPSVALGSVKSMISHLIPASGVASLIKTALALYHRVLPPTLHAEKPNAELCLEKTPFYLSTTTRPWIHGDRAVPRRAGVDAFGFGGIDAHAILEEHVPADESNLVRMERDWPAELVVLSAVDRAGLRQKARELASRVDAEPATSLLDIAAAAAAQDGPCRVALVASDKVDLAKKLAFVTDALVDENRTRIQDRSGIFWYAQPLARDSRVAFVFPGEGAQYTNMLADLCRHFPVVRQEFDRTDAAFRRSGSGRPISRLIFPLPEETEQAEQELLELGGAVTSVALAGRALWRLMGHFGIRPDAVLGHSSGEFAALSAAGAIAPEGEEAWIETIADGNDSAVELVASGLVGPAVLTAVGGTDRNAVAQILNASSGRLVMAMDNCPSQMVLSGDEGATAAALQELRGKGGLCERLPWGRAYHTEGFGPASAIIERYYDRVGLRTPTVELWSCVTADRYPSEPAAVKELAVRQWRSAVRFRETIEAMYASGIRIFVEIGPRGNLSAFIADTLGKRPFAAVPLDVHRREGITQLCRALGMLAAHGVRMDLARLFEPRRPNALDLGEPPRSRPVSDPVLNLRLPELSLSASAAAAFRRSAPAGRTTEKSQSYVPVAPSVAETVAPVAAPPQPVPEPRRLSPAPQRVAVASARQAAPPEDTRARALADYQRTMRMFLETQARVMTGRAVVAAFPAESPPTLPALDAAQLGSLATTLSTAPALLPAKPPSPGVTPAVSRVNAPPVPPAADEHAASGTANDELPLGPVSVNANVLAQGEARRSSAAPAPEIVDDAKVLSPEKVLLQIVSDRTGYPVEMLDLDANMEADLGIDSIKRVEVIGAFRRAIQHAGGEQSDKLTERMAEAKTLRGIVASLAGNSAETAAAAVPEKVNESAAPRRPFIEYVLLHEPGHRLIAECELAVEKHPFLLDHTFFGRELSVHDPALAAMPVMPLAMTLELLAESAMMLCPDQEITALTDVRTMRWLAFETPSRRVRMDATVVDPGRVRVVVSEADREGMSAVITEGTVEFGLAPSDLGSAVVDDLATSPAHWAYDIYERILFHGPAFRGIASIEACDPAAVRAVVREPDPELLFLVRERPELVLPVSLIDVATQVPGMLYGDWSPEDAKVHMVYPNRLERLEFLRKRPSDTPLHALATVRRDGQHLHSNLEVKTADDQVVLRMTGRACQVVDFPTGIHHYSKSPRSVTCSRDISDAFKDVPGAKHCVVCEIANATGPILLNRLWSQAFGHMILDSEERRVFAALKLPPAAVASWLIGRAVAKDAVRLHAALDVCMADVRIVNGTDGKPHAEIRQGTAPLISLAHKDYMAVAVAAEARRFRGVGIDVEQLGVMEPGLVADAFTAHERALIEAAAQGSAKHLDQWYFATWAAKEAVGKALGRGALGGPLSIQVRAIEPTTGRLQMALCGAMAKAFPEFAPAPEREVLIDVYRRIRGHHGIALCLLTASA